MARDRDVKTYVVSLESDDRRLLRELLNKKKKTDRRTSNKDVFIEALRELHIVNFPKQYRTGRIREVVSRRKEDITLGT